MSEATNGTQAPALSPTRFERLMQEYAQRCMALGELEYHYQCVIPKRRKDLLHEMNQLQKQAERCKTLSARMSEETTETNPESDATSEQS